MQEKKEIYSSTIPEELLGQLKRMAAWECRSTAGMLRVLVRSGVEAFEEGQKSAKKP